MHALPSDVGDILVEVRNLYREYFDRSWFTSVLGEVRMDAADLQDIRHALTLTDPTIWDLPVLHRGLAALRLYVRLVRCSILPRARVSLGSSYPGTPSFKEGSDERLHRRLAVYALPQNLDRLSSLVDKLDDRLPPIPKAMPSLRVLAMPGSYIG